MNNNETCRFYYEELKKKKNEKKNEKVGRDKSVLTLKQTGSEVVELTQACTSNKPGTVARRSLSGSLPSFLLDLAQACLHIKSYQPNLQL